MARKMKDSGIEWIGEIPEGWEIAKAKYFIDISHGSDPKTQGFIPVYGSGSESFKTCGEYKEGPAVLIGRKGATLHIPHYIEGKYWNVDTAFDVKSKSHCILKFYYYLAACFDYKYYISQTTLPGMTQSNYYNMFLPVPSLSKQFQIATYLDAHGAAFDFLISKVRSSIEEYKKLKQAVITQAVTKGVRGEREMKDSGVDWIGEINHRFSLIKLKYICSILDQYRKPISADKRSQSGSVLYDYYGASGAIDKIDDYTIDDHVMLIGEDGANLRMRNLPLMYEVNGKAWINNHAHILKPTERVDFYYLFYALEELDINPYITGSAQPKLSQEKLQNIWVPLPDLEEQQEIATYIRSKCAEIDGLVAKKEQLVKELESYKKSLIYEVVTGKREV